MKPFTYLPGRPDAGEAPILRVFHGRPRTRLPAGACDSHVHVFGPRDRYPLADDRTFAPGIASLTDLVALHERIGVERTVIVQASPQGSDNRCVLEAVAAMRGRGRDARAVVVIPEGTSDRVLEDLHGAGVRGLRVNLQSYGKTDPAVASRGLQVAAAMAVRMGWHIQVYTSLAVVSAVRDAIRDLPVPLVIDHFALADASAGVSQAGFTDLLALLREGKVYVKLSAPYRVIDRVDGSDALPIVRALVEANVHRMLWGTDWPHTGPWPGLSRDREGEEPFHPVDDGAMLDMFFSWTTHDEQQRILVDNPAQLYGF
jgi:predicted TIM-barrel fold metal-dependent hydrolase